MALHTLDIVALVAYLLLITGIGFYCSRKNTNTEEYFVGGRSFSGWVIGLSLVASGYFNCGLFFLTVFSSR